MKINYEGDLESSYFNSQAAVDIFGMKSSKFRPTGLHFHYPSEHTVDGKHYDLELHIGHKAFGQSNPEGLAVDTGVIVAFFSMSDFSSSITNDQNQTMSNFFTQLRLDLDSLDQEESGPDEFGFTFNIGTLSLKDVMGAFDFSKRWVYLGNSSIPPCKKYVYWNVLETVYPIEPKYLLMIRAKYEGRLKNARSIFPVNRHNIQYISAIRLVFPPMTSLVAAAALIYLS